MPDAQMLVMSNNIPYIDEKVNEAKINLLIE
jgi:hypothetical protein